MFQICLGNDKNIGMPSPQCQSVDGIWCPMIYQQKMTNSLTNKRRVLIGSYIHISNLLNFDMNDMVSFDNKKKKKIFFVFNAYFNTNLLFGCLVASFNGTLRYVQC